MVNKSSTVNRVHHAVPNMVEPTTTPITVAPKSPETSLGHVQGSLQRPSWLSNVIEAGPSKQNVAATEINQLQLNFDIIKKFDALQTAQEAGHPVLPGTIAFSRSKNEVGGSDMGVLGKINEHEFLIKTGLGRGLLGQIAIHFSEGKADKAEKKVGFIVGDYIRMIGDKSVDGKVLQVKLFGALRSFFHSAEGKKIISRAKSSLMDVADVNKVHGCVVASDPVMKNVLGIPILMDVVNGTSGQQLVNEFQKSYLAENQVPDSRLILVCNNPLIGSKFLGDAEPFDDFLTKHFLPSGVELADVVNAADVLKKSGKGEIPDSKKIANARELMSDVLAPQNLASGKEKLATQLKQDGLDNLFSSVLMRLTMGENSDLGPDNMLVVRGQDGRNKVVNIDVTGFRFERQNDFQAKPTDKVSFGWGDIFKSPQQGMDKLMDPMVFNGRYVGQSDLQAAISSILKENIGEQAESEIDAVKQWYGSLDAEGSKAALKGLATRLASELDAELTPDARLLDKAIERNCKFIDSACSQAKQ